MNTATLPEKPLNPTAQNPDIPTLESNSASSPAPTGVDSVGILGTVDVLSETEQQDFQACETVIARGWCTFVEVGLALAEIRDQRLYRIDFLSFEAYCHAMWEYGRRYVDQMINAAQLFRDLRANCSHIQPDHESQLRPLIGLPIEQAQLAWECAAQLAAGRRITAGMVKAAVKGLQLRPNEPTARSIGPNRTDQRRQITAALGELLGLLRNKAAHESMIEKVEELYSRVQALFAPPTRKVNLGNGR